MSYYQENRQHINEYRRRLLQKNIINKKYYCSDCDKAYRDKTQLNRHLNSKKHNNNYKHYRCPFADCMYENKAKYHLDIHLNSRKHKGCEIPVS